MSLLQPTQLSSGRRVNEYVVPFLEDTTVRVRSLSEWEQSKFEAGQLTRSGKINKSAIEAGRRKYIALCLVNEHGDTYLTADQLEQADSRLVNWLYRTCCEHNGMNEDEQAELVGNSKGVRDSSSE